MQDVCLCAYVFKSVADKKRKSTNDVEAQVCIFILRLLPLRLY